MSIISTYFDISVQRVEKVYIRKIKGGPDFEAGLANLKAVEEKAAAVPAS